MDSVVQLLTGLADSPVRAFRHTATFCAMKLVTALVELLVDIVEQCDKNQKQLETERNRQEQQQVSVVFCATHQTPRRLVLCDATRSSSS